MQLKIKLQTPTNKKQEKKRELNMTNGRELHDKLYTINYQFSMISFTPSIINFPVGEWRNHGR